MKKMLFMALMACGMTAMVACSDNDNEPKGTHSETYTLRFENEDDDSSELDKLTSTYAQALGKSDLQTYDSITITGRDSADCNALFRTQMSAAEKVLGSIAFTSEPKVLAYDCRDSVIYAHNFSAGDNAEMILKVNRFSNYEEYCAKNGNYVGMIAIKKGGIDKDHPTSCDINKWARQELRLVAYAANDTLKPITGLFIWDATMAKDQTVRRNITWEGKNYELAPAQVDGKIDKNVIYNLNEGNKYAHKLYLYYTRDNANYPRLYLPALAIGYRYKNTFWIGKSYECFDSYFNGYWSAFPEPSYSNHCAIYDSFDYTASNVEADLNTGIEGAMYEYLLVTYGY